MTKHIASDVYSPYFSRYSIFYAVSILLNSKNQSRNNRFQFLTWTKNRFISDFGWQQRLRSNAWNRRRHVCTHIQCLFYPDTETASLFVWGWLLCHRSAARSHYIPNGDDTHSPSDYRRWRLVFKNKDFNTALSMVKIPVQHAAQVFQQMPFEAVKTAPNKTLCNQWFK